MKSHARGLIECWLQKGLKQGGKGTTSVQSLSAAGQLQLWQGRRIDKAHSSWAQCKKVSEVSPMLTFLL